MKTLVSKTKATVAALAILLTGAGMISLGMAAVFTLVIIASPILAAVARKNGQNESTAHQPKTAPA